jgi:hypothetical protein
MIQISIQKKATENGKSSERIGDDHKQVAKPKR